MSIARATIPPSPSSNWAYFLDVDGTLLEIAQTPADVEVDTYLLKLIAKLHHRSAGAVALVSGRSLSDLDALFGLTRLPMAGQHGLERRDVMGRLRIHPALSTAKCTIKEALTHALARHPSLLLEDKGLTLAIHYRLAPQLASYVHRLTTRLVSMNHEGLELQRGKRVIEVKPAGINKGTAIAEYMLKPPFLGRTPVFIGDDLSDEHGFSEVNRLGGISIKVGSTASCARYRLPNVVAVRSWLATGL